MSNYNMQMDVEYELWERGYRINNKNFSINKFVEILNAEENERFLLEEILNNLLETNPDWFINIEEEEDKYREENEPKVREIFEKYFQGRTWEEIKNNEELYERWGFYSDYHKDVFGYRPHDIVCGVYVSPY